MNKSEAEAGYTTIEALVSVALIALAGAIMLGISAVSIRSLAASKNAASVSANALAIDGALRAAIGRVRVPWWERRFAVTEGDSRASVAWLDGFPDRELSVSESGGHLVMEESGRGILYRSGAEIDSLSVETLRDPGGFCAGLEIRYGVGGTAFTCVAPFASRSLGEP